MTVQYIPAPPALAASCPQRWLIRLRSSYPPTAASCPQRWLIRLRSSYPPTAASCPQAALISRPRVSR
ncbi:hypothetical protein QIG99_27920, partial [Klebsiella pneumoniae]|nr:hypothetical protein [Klebsiella pneumoniae]